MATKPTRRPAAVKTSAAPPEPPEDEGFIDGPDEPMEIDDPDGPDKRSGIEPWDAGFEEIGAPRGAVHPTRSAEARDHEPVHDEMDDFETIPANTAAPPAREGFVQRWVRMETGGGPDGMNWSRRMRQGWVPRDPATVPSSFNMPIVRRGRRAEGTGMIAVQGLVLCEMPEQLAERYRAAVKRKQARMQEGIDGDLFKVQRPGHPIKREATTKVTRRPPVAA